MMINDEKTLWRWEDEALGACHAAGRALLLRGENRRPLAFVAGVLCERYARACADRAAAEVSPAWAGVWRAWHEAAIEWLIIAKRGEAWEALANS